MLIPLIIGIGNPFRSDDGIGQAVIEQLRSTLQGRVDWLECTGDPCGLLAEWQGRAQVIVIDACRHDAEPAGKIFRLNGLEASLPAGSRSTSSHAFSLADAITLGMQLNALPTSLTIYAVVGKNFSAGNTLSLAAQQAVSDLCKRIPNEITPGGQSCMNTPC